MKWILQDIPFGQNIKALRLAKNMTQQEVVNKLSKLGSTMSRVTLANIELGNRNIKASDLKALKVLFDATYEDFFKE